MTPTDPIAFTIVTLLLMAVRGLACVFYPRSSRIKSPADRGVTRAMNQVQALRKQNFVKAKPILLIVAAQRCNVLRLILRQEIGLALIGILIGTAGALVVTQSLRSLLFLVKPNEPWVLAGTSLLLFAVALLACWFPARCAARVDPMEALRYE